jgi:hypothetical protein
LRRGKKRTLIAASDGTVDPADAPQCEGVGDLALTIATSRLAKKEVSLPDPTYMSAITDSALRSGVGD